jgi:alkylglycerol monooxygenase
MEQIILYALPVFALLIAAEWTYGVVRGKCTYRLNDSVASLSQGLLSQAVAVCTQLFQVGLYSLAFARLAVIHDPAFWRTAWGWLVAIVLFDFCDYWLHRAGHEIAVFWAAHVVHHQSEDFNFSTALRQETMVPLLGWVFYVPMAILGVPPAQFLMAGLIVLLYQFWIHTEHVGKLGWFDRVFSSPSNHRVHHAVNPQYINKNYGGMLVIWDRMFGTFAEEEEPCVYGTQTPLASWDPVWAVASVYVNLARDAMNTTRIADKLRIWFMPTGWRPADLLAAEQAMHRPTAPAARYDPPVSNAQAIVAVLQLVFMVILTTALLSRADSLPGLTAASLCVTITVGLWIAGAVMQGRVRLRLAFLGDLLILATAMLALW